MGILGLTHDENGSALEKLPVTIRSHRGGPEPGSQNDHPRVSTTSCSSAKRFVTRMWLGSGAGHRTGSW